MDPNPNEPTAVPPQAEYIPPTPYPPPPVTSGLSDNMAGALAYITFIPAIIFLILDPYNRSAFVRFHSIQCLAFWVVSFTVHTVLAFIPIVGWAISALLSLVFFIFWIICIVKASKGEWYKLPVIGDFAMQQART